MKFYCIIQILGCVLCMTYPYMLVSWNYKIINQTDNYLDVYVYYANRTIMREQNDKTDKGHFNHFRLKPHGGYGLINTDKGRCLGAIKIVGPLGKFFDGVNVKGTLPVGVNGYFSYDIAQGARAYIDSVARCYNKTYSIYVNNGKYSFNKPKKSKKNKK